MKPSPTWRPPARNLIEQVLDDAVGKAQPFDLELPMMDVSGNRFWTRTIGTVEYDEGRPVRLVGAIQDITARKQGEVDLARSRRLLQVTLDSIADAVITTDNEARVQWLNPVAERITGWDKVDAVGKPLDEIFRIVDETTLEPVRDPASLCLGDQRAISQTGRSTLLARSGTFGIEHSASPIRDDAGAVHGAVLVFHDVSEQRRLANELSHRASHDLLTGLLNRSEFEARLARVLAAASVTTDPHVLLYIDLDQFKLVNDACGHSAGDRLLRQFSVILNDCVRSEDSVARLGGDEFGLLLERCLPSDAQAIAQRICDEMDAFRFTHESRRFRVGTSIGLVAIDHRWRSIAELLQVADASCYAAKEGGRNRVHTWFDSDQIVEARHGDMQWVSRLELALDEDRFELFAQRIEPIGEPSRRLHFEVLLRKRERDGTLVLPGAFLPVAERFHLATRIDRWVVKKAFGWLRNVSDREDSIEMMAINLSGQSLGDRAFHQDILDLVRHAGFDVRKLCFEITETAAITHLTDARAFIEQIRGLGVKVALDDFGAGASSFGYLKSLPVDFLKIDGHFIRHMLDDELNNVAVRCFCDVARTVGVKTIAECVETREVRDALEAIGVDMTQGFLVHRPEPLENMLECETA